VTWAALGALGVCQDGFPIDEDGAGLWPLALHNWVVRNMGRRPPKRRRPFLAFEVGRQSRFVSIGDVLSTHELQSVELSRGTCVMPWLVQLWIGEPVTAELSERDVAAGMLLYLIDRARDTLDRERVRGWAALEARRFDLDLQLAALAAREARRDTRNQLRLGRQAGLAPESLAVMRGEAPATTLHPDSEPARILAGSVDWPASEWMTLSPDRRLFLFHHARVYGDPEAFEPIAVGILDALLAEGDGEGVDTWIGMLDAAERPDVQRRVWEGERGQRLLALDEDSGFSERGVIALHRGVHQLEQGDLTAALRSMAFALQLAPESRSPDELQGLSRRWLSYVASQFEVTDELLATLQELVPTRDYNILLEDLMWRAAFHADQASFERGMANQRGRGALDRRLGLLEPLARGEVGTFSTGIRDGLRTSPSETLRFLDQLVQRLEREDATVREAHVLTLVQLRKVVFPLTPEGGGEPRGRQARTASELIDRTGALLEGVGALGVGGSMHDRARALAPTGEVFAGAVRLAPADPLPWPFQPVQVAAPSVFAPLELVPTEWQDASGTWVLGWSIGG
jgi:hypothetical protein